MVLNIYFQEYLDKLYTELENLRMDNGLYIASTGEYYRKFCWLRDIFYSSRPNLHINPDKYVQTYHTLLDWLLFVEKKYNKFSGMIENPHPLEPWRFLHARIKADIFDEVHEPWGNAQNDVVGEILFGIAEGEKAGLHIIRNDKDINIINKTIKYLQAIEYYVCKDSSLWEENLEIHASAIGAVVAGLKAIESLHIEGIVIPDNLISLGELSLKMLLPNESITKDTDLALLTLIYPFNIVDDSMRDLIIYNVEKNLVRTNGVIRYKNDRYYNRGGEAEWTMGKLFLAHAYIQKGEYSKAKKYLSSVLELCPDGKIPELYYARTNEANINKPLAWSNSLAIEALLKLREVY